MSAIYRASKRTCPHCNEANRVREYTQPALTAEHTDRDVFDCQACGYTMDVETMDAGAQPTSDYRSVYMTQERV